MSREGSTSDVYRPRLQRRLIVAFAGYTLFVGALLGGLSMAFAYVVEDQFFAGTLRTEAGRQQTHRAREGTWTEPAQQFMHVYARDAALPPDLAVRRAANPKAREFAGDDGRYYHILPLDDDGTLLVAEVGELLVVRRLRGTLLLWVIGAATGLALAALPLAWALSRRASAPLERLAERVAASAPEALPEGLATGLSRDEVGELARHLDRLHARTREFIEREQALTADISHELRTPLAVLGIACERLHAQVPEHVQPMVRSMQLSAWQLRQAVELLLATAREAPGDGSSRAPEPLLPVVEQLVLAHAPLLEQQGVEVEIDVSPRLTRPWPPALTHVLLGNLLANSIAHAQRPWVRIEADEARLSVCNASAPPPEALLGGDAAGRRRGVKSAASAGHGLGLSIVRRLAARHALALDLSHHDGRTCATLREVVVTDDPGAA